MFRIAIPASVKNLAVSAAVLLVTGAPVLAGQYDLVKGKGVEVCEAYDRYLAHQKRELTCEREFPPGFTDFRRPAWQQLDPQKNKLLVLRIKNYLQMPRDERAMKPMVPAHREDALDTLYISEFARLAITQLDINNDGMSESVAKFRSFRCDTWGLAASPRGPQWVAPLVVLNDSKEDVDREKTYPLMQNPRKVYASNAGEIEMYFETHKTEKNVSLRRPRTVWKESKYAPGSAELMGYDAFLFKNQAYFDKWDEQEGQKGIHTLFIYHAHNNEADEVCRYRWLG